MKYFIIAIGHMKNSPEEKVFNKFYKRLKNKIFIKEYVSNLSSQKLRKEDESKKLFSMAKGLGKKILLDKSGKEISSIQLSKLINDWKNQGHNSISFLIGGSEGFDDKIMKNIDYSLSLGKMTWPHLMARTMLLEQIYRSETILSNHPYHRP